MIRKGDFLLCKVDFDSQLRAGEVYVASEDEFVFGFVGLVRVVGIHEPYRTARFESLVTQVAPELASLLENDSIGGC